MLTKDERPCINDLNLETTTTQLVEPLLHAVHWQIDVHGSLNCTDTFLQQIKFCRIKGTVILVCSCMLSLYTGEYSFYADHYIQKENKEPVQESNREISGLNSEDF